MGWIGRRTTSAAPARPGPIVADSHELARARQLLQEFERSQTTGGSEAAMDRALPVVVDHTDADNRISLGQVLVMCAIEARGDATAVDAAERATAERVLRSAGMWAVP